MTTDELARLERLHLGVVAMRAQLMAIERDIADLLGASPRSSAGPGDPNTPGGIPREVLAAEALLRRAHPTKDDIRANVFGRKRDTPEDPPTGDAPSDGTSGAASD